jgi:integrase
LDYRTSNYTCVGKHADDVRALIAAAAGTNPALGAFLLLGATTGARRGELLALRSRDVDLDGASLSFQRSLIDGANDPVLAPTKTRRSHRVALDVASTAALTALRAQCAEPVDLDRFVFSGDPGGRIPWQPNWMTKAFIRCRGSLGLAHLSVT